MFIKILRGIKGLWFFGWGNIISLFIYERKYLQGKFFRGRLGGINSIGWRWAVYDGLSRIILGVNKGIPFPVSPRIIVSNPANIYFCVDDLNNFQTTGNYYQAIRGKIIIGRGCWIAPNVGIITTNHDLTNPDNHIEGKDVVLGERCWIGMNSVILPGVVLGPHTIVGAGSVVTKSFTEGYCVIAGNPAKKIKDIKNERI